MMAKNVLGTALQPCCVDPKTGFFRDGSCFHHPQDRGLHLLCAEMTGPFLQFTKARGNDLSTPVPDFDFPGLQPGDRWCLCVSRWVEALDAGLAPPVVLESTHEKTLDFIPLRTLRQYASAL